MLLIASWALYDLANQFFGLNVVSLYFPRWLTGPKGTSEIFYGLSFSFSMLVVFLLAPLFGTISDLQNKRKRYLIWFTLLCVICTFLIGLLNHVFLALVLFALANIGFQISIVFYNAILVHISPQNRIGLVSGIGRMAGYSGAILALFGSKFVIADYGYRGTFFMTTIAFLIFALPSFVFIKEASGPAPGLKEFLSVKKIASMFRDIVSSFKKDARFKSIRYFLLMFFLAMCAVQPILIFMAVYAAKVFGLSEQDIVNLIMVSTFFAIAGSWLFGFMADRFGSKKMMRFIFWLWVAGLVLAALLSPPFHWLIGGIIGLALGGIWVVGRSWAIHLVPKENVGQVFGLFNIVSYAGGIVGPVFWSIMLFTLSFLGVWKYRATMLICLLFLVGSLRFMKKISA